MIKLEVERAENQNERCASAIKVKHCEINATGTEILHTVLALMEIYCKQTGKTMKDTNKVLGIFIDCTHLETEQL